MCGKLVAMNYHQLMPSQKSCWRIYFLFDKPQLLKEIRISSTSSSQINNTVPAFNFYFQSEPDSKHQLGPIAGAIWGCQAYLAG